jgi:hypothetical protein
MPYAYREDTGKKNKGRAFLDEGSSSSVLDEDGLAIMAATALAASKDSGTYKTPSK